MGAHDAVGIAAVFGNGGLSVRGRRDHHQITRLVKCALDEARHRVSSGEPHSVRRHFEPYIVLHQLGEGGDVRIFECRAIAFDQRKDLAVVGFGDVVGGGGNLGEVGVASPA